jgi:dihydrolipoamide dehydrogenase
MPDTLKVTVPDIGDAADVEVIEVLVKAGDVVAAEQPLLTLESDKASMDVPAPRAGVIAAVLVKVGDRVSEGTHIVDIAAQGAAVAPVAEDGGDGATAAAHAAHEHRADTPAAADPDDDDNDDGDFLDIGGGTAVAAGDEEAVGVSVDDVTEVRCEVAVLGAGPGGYTAAFRSADLGKNTVLIERYADLGGVCLNVGCIPSKALLHTAEVIAAAKAMSAHGVEFGAPKLDLARLANWKDSVVGQLTKGLAGLARQRKVQVLHGVGAFTSPNTLRVEGGDGVTLVHFESAIIAAGSQAVKIPGFPYHDERLMDSTDALELADVPARLLVIGGGIIGLEMACVYQALGSRITVVELLDTLMPGADRDIVRPLEKRIQKLYENIFLDTRVTAIRSTDAGLEVSFEGGNAPPSDVFDRVLVAVGRAPNGKRIGADKAGVQVDERGFIKVDRQQRSNVAHVFAIGDIVGQPMLAHKATHEGKVAAEVAAGEKSSFDALTVPSVAYTDPEVAWCGLTESEATAKGIEFEKSTFPWAASGRALGIGRSEGLTKLIFDKSSGRLLGAGIVGPHAGDLIAEATLALEMGADAQDIGLTVHPHPTLSETVAFAAEMAEGTITDLYLPRHRL